MLNKHSFKDSVIGLDNTARKFKGAYLVLNHVIADPR